MCVWLKADEPQAGRHAWTVVALLLALPAALMPPGPGGASGLSGLPGLVLAWEPQRAWAEPWRWWSAAWVHLSSLHLMANLAGAVLVLLLGWVARLPREAAWAWALAWPLVHLSLVLEPALRRYGGLSGVLHAGVVVAAVTLVRTGPGRRERLVGAALLGGVVLKVLTEQPWAQVLVARPGWDIAVAPLAHASGVFWGTLLALVLGLARVRSRPSSPVPPPGWSAG